MLPGLIRRELTLAVRDGALRSALLIYLLTVLTSGILFVVQGVGVAGRDQGMAAAAVVGRVLTVPWVLSGVLLPWAWWRLAWREQGGDLLRWSLRCGADPGKVALAKLFAGHLYMLEAMALSAPLLVVAWATSTVPASVPVAGTSELLTFLLLAGTAIVWWNLTARAEMVALGVSYLLLATLALLRHGLALAVAVGGRITANLLVAALLATLLVIKRRSRLRELEAMT